MQQEPVITTLLDDLDGSKDQVVFMQAFENYLQDIERHHCMHVLRQVVRDSDLLWSSVVECKQDILQGIYQVHLVTKDN